MILQALDEAGGADYLKEQAERNPAAFLTLVGKIMPRDIKAEHSGRPTLEALSWPQLRRSTARQARCAKKRHGFPPGGFDGPPRRQTHPGILSGHPLRCSDRRDCAVLASDIKGRAIWLP